MESLGQNDDPKLLSRDSGFSGCFPLSTFHFPLSGWRTILIAAFLLLLPVVTNAASLKVVTTLFPLYEFAKEVGGSRAQVSILLPPGAEPHTWEPRPSDIVKVSAADIFIYVGEHMEPWAHDVLKAVGGRDITVMSVMDSLDFLASDEGHVQPDDGLSDPGHPADPHIWLDLSLAARTVETIGRLFANEDPGHGAAYLERARIYATGLRKLDERYTSSLSACRTRRFVTGGHGAFGYLADRYNLDQLSLYGINPDSEPGPRHMADLAKTMKKEQIDVIFFEELVNPRLAQVLAEETGARTLTLNPGANLSSKQADGGITFIRLMENNLENLREGLDCD